LTFKLGILDILTIAAIAAFNVNANYNKKVVLKNVAINEDVK